MQSTKDLLNNYDFGSTYRVDRWWSQPLGVFVGLSLFVIYGTSRLLYPIFNPSAPGIEYESLLSPFFSPLLFMTGYGMRFFESIQNFKSIKNFKSC